MTLPAGPAEARSSSSFCYKACAATVFGAVQMKVVNSVPLPRCSYPSDVRWNSTNRSNHTRHFPGGYDLFYIIDVTGQDSTSRIPEGEQPGELSTSKIRGRIREGSSWK